MVSSEHFISLKKKLFQWNQEFNNDDLYEKETPAINFEEFSYIDTIFDNFNKGDIFIHEDRNHNIYLEIRHSDKYSGFIYDNKKYSILKKGYLIVGIPIKEDKYLNLQKIASYFTLIEKGK